MSNTWYQENIDEARRRAREYYQAHKEERKEYSRKYRKEHPDKVKDDNKKYRESSHETFLQLQKNWRVKNADYVKNYHKEYFKKNPHKRAEYERKRRAKKKGCWGNVPTGLWEKVLEFYGNMCLCCGTSNDLTQDHVVPLDRGGLHDVSNLQPLCGHCNSVKRTKTVDYRNGRIFTA